MAQKANKIQSNFNAGILSPYIESRPDVAQYYNGLLVGRNIALLPEGGFQNMPGTRYVTAAKNNDLQVLIAFEPNDRDSFELEFGNGYIRFRKNGLPIKEPDVELVVNGGFDTDLASWIDTFTGAGSSGWVNKLGGQLELHVDAAGGTAQRHQGFATTVGETYVVTFRVIAGPPVLVFVVPSPGDVQETASLTAGQGYHSFLFTATTDTTIVAVRLTHPSGLLSATADVDNFSVRRATVPLYEITSPYGEADLLEIRGGQGIRQVNDALFIAVSTRKPHELVYGGDTNWTLRESPFDPLPSTEADTDLNDEGGTSFPLTPGATTGNGVTFSTADPIFKGGDIGRVIKYGASRAWIDVVVDDENVVCNIMVAFPNTDPIPAGEWVLEGSPGGPTNAVPFGVTLNINAKGPVGRVVDCIFGAGTMRPWDVGKYLKVYGGVLEILKYINDNNVQAKILSELSDADKDDPDAALGGGWRLEKPAWSNDLGWPSLNEFYQGRYALAANANQPTTKWFSQTNRFYNFATGVLATDALEYTHRSGRFGKLKWIIENGVGLFFADYFSVQSLQGRGDNEPIGGDEVPIAKSEGHIGSSQMRPIHVGQTVMFLHWSKRKIMGMAYSFESDSQIAKQVTFLTRDLTTDVPRTFTRGMTNHFPAYIEEPIPLVFWLREDGVLLCQSFNEQAEGGNNGWTTVELDGKVISMCAARRGQIDVLSLVVERVINSITVHYIEEISPEVHDLDECAWSEMQTQAGVVYILTSGAAITIIDGLEHLEGEEVDVLIYRTGGIDPFIQVPRYMLNGDTRYIVGDGFIELNEVVDYPCVMEIGKPFTPLVKTLRPAIPNQPTDGHLRRWTKCMLRLHRSSLPTVNGSDMQAQRSIDALEMGPYLRSGDLFVDTSDDSEAEVKQWDWSLDGYVEITRSRPYPLRVLLLAGEVEFSQSMAEAVGNEGIIHVPE